MATKFPMTPAGRDKMKAELDHMKKVMRPAISEQIEVAREHGDLKENAEYHAAKEKQGMIEARIRDFETKVALAEVIDPEKLSGTRVVFGATVTLLDVDTDAEITYSIVGENEADFKQGRLNLMSPIARGILGKEEGDEVEVTTGAGVRTFEILEVEFKKIEMPPPNLPAP